MIPAIMREVLLCEFIPDCAHVYGASKRMARICERAGRRLEGMRGQGSENGDGGGR